MSSVRSATSSGTASANEAIGKWEVYEINMTTTNTYSNPYKDVTLSATFNGPNAKEIIIEGFWDGGFQKESFTKEALYFIHNQKAKKRDWWRKHYAQALT